LPTGFQGLSVLDAFAGVGALGLEALSRGAARASFLDTNRAAIDVITRQCRTLNALQDVVVLHRDATNPGQATAPHQIAFLDPPYGRGLVAPALAALETSNWLTRDVWLAIETAKTDPAPNAQGYSLMAERRVGNAQLWLLRRD
jgi:16S rRNA (guanine966-N2)-methyltransferase